MIAPPHAETGMRRQAVPILLLLVTGCGPRPLVPVPVKGTVTLDGKPLQEGQISFITPGQVPEILPISEGSFSGEVKPGEKRIEIAAYRPVRIPKDVPASLRPLMQGGKENYLPARYHRDSILTETVRDRGDNEFQFALTSK
jgi:hypothetical protein